jgi:hypothetical protein
MMAQTRTTQSQHGKATQQPQNETAAEAMANVSMEDNVDNVMTEIDTAETEKRHGEERREDDGEEDDDDDDAEGTYSDDDEEDDETDESSSTHSSNYKEQYSSNLLAEVEKLTAAFPDLSKTYKITGKIGEGNTPMFILAPGESH